MPAPFTFRALTASVGLLCLAGAAALAQRERPPSPITVTEIPATSTSGPVVKIKTAHPVDNRYRTFGVKDNTTFDLTEVQFISTADHPQHTALSVGEQPDPPTNIRIVGGVFDGGIPREWNWRLTHGFGGSGIYTVATGLQVLEGVRIHNFGDGWTPRETPSFRLRSYPNTGRFLLKGCYMTGIRDDAIENDEFIPGEVQDCLLDGVWTFLSEQNERQNAVRRYGVQTIGPDEDPTIRLTRVLVRVTITNANETGPGRWFKLQPYDSRNHRLIITDCVFATHYKPRNGWRLLNFPKDATFRGTNYVLWLGEPGTYQAEVPKGVIFLDGRAAKDKWHQVRNEWLERHGYTPRGPDDWDPMQAPVAPPRRRQGVASDRPSPLLQVSQIPSAA